VFNELNSKSAKLQFVKEQILIRYLRLGWTKAYHPWLKNKYVYSPSELMEHFVESGVAIAKHRGSARGASDESTWATNIACLRNGCT